MRPGKYDTSSAPCKPRKVHKWTVVSSIRGYKNCYWCGASKWVGR